MDHPVVTLCECGSGLRRQRCCDLHPESFPSPEASRQLTPLVEQAIQEHRQGRTANAERLCIDVLELAPGQTGALSLLYQIRKAQGDSRAAEALLRRKVALDVNDIIATNELTLILFEKGSLAEAEGHARNAIRIAPENPQAHNLMGMVMTESNHPQSGEYHYRRVLELTRKREPVVLANLAWNLKNQGRMAEARALYRESIAAAPGVRQTLLGFARLEEADRQFDAAGMVLDRMDRLFANDPAVKLARAVLLGRERRYEPALAMINSIASGDARLGPTELLEKGRLLDELGRYDDAWAAFTEGKQRAHELSGQAYLDQAAREQFERLKNFFTAGRLGLIPRARVRTDVPQPVFILGFPRSGTTLVEQTLSAHPMIAAGDELPLISEITAIMPRLLASPLGYPEALAELWMGDRRDGLDSLRDYYLQKVQQMGVLHQGAARFTDKMPLNETHLGLIALLFPEAPLIHVLRHPLDIMVSAFSNAFTHGFCCASALETAAQHFVRVMDLVEHYRAEMRLRYFPVRYEDIIANQEASVRDMLNFVGEQFDPACLAFHENRRYARTASYAQVTQPLYARSVARWRRYVRHLEPVIPILHSVMERLGYTLDYPPRGCISH